MKSKLVSSLSLLVALGLTLGSCLDDETVTPNQQLLEDIEKIDSYLKANPPVDPTDIIVKDASGIRMVITEQGAGEIPPTLANTIHVKYSGRLFSNGNQFQPESSLTFTLAVEDDGFDVIRGWKLALSMMTEGTKATVYIPSGLAYGPSGKGSSIPDNAILVFELELVIVNTNDEAAQRIIDSGKINAELEAVPNVVNHPSGISYILEPIGSGTAPTLYDQVAVRYTGRVLGGEVFADNIEQGPVNIFSSMVVNYIHGLIVGLQIMHEGDKATFYIPSALGYGTTSFENVPSNSVLIFEVELLEVIPNMQ